MSRETWPYCGRIIREVNDKQEGRVREKVVKGKKMPTDGVTTYLIVPWLPTHKIPRVKHKNVKSCLYTPREVKTIPASTVFARQGKKSTPILPPVIHVKVTPKTLIYYTHLVKIVVLLPPCGRQEGEEV
jgi:hypothetical protein